jgi:hypothetical protein
MLPPSPPRHSSAKQRWFAVSVESHERSLNPSALAKERPRHCVAAEKDQSCSEDAAHEARSSMTMNAMEPLYELWVFHAQTASYRLEKHALVR